MYGKEAKVKHLWHGSRTAAPEKIYGSDEGFDVKLASLGGRHGAGIYFAIESRYSVPHYCWRHPNGEYGLFYAATLPGETGTAVDTCRRQPKINPKSNLPFDCVRECYDENIDKEIEGKNFKKRIIKMDPVDLDKREIRRVKSLLEGSHYPKDNLTPDEQKIKDLIRENWPMSFCAQLLKKEQCESLVLAVLKANKNVDAH